MHVAGTDADTCASAAFGPSRRAQVRDNGKPVELAQAEDTEGGLRRFGY